MEGNTRGLPSRISSIHGSDKKWKHMQVKWIFRLSYVNIYIICCSGGGHFKIANKICRGMVKFLKNDMLVCFGGLLHPYNGVNRATEQN